MIHALNARYQHVLVPLAMTNTQTTSANIDTLGADYATIIISLKSEINTNAVGPTISLKSANDTQATSFATVIADRTAEDITNGRIVVYQVPCGAGRRYLNLSVTTATATNDNVTVSATALLSRREVTPSNTTDMVATTNDVVVMVS